MTVLEASGRAGGRVRTLYDLPGQPEAGGTQIGMNAVEKVSGTFAIDLFKDGMLRLEGFVQYPL